MTLRIVPLLLVSWITASTMAFAPSQSLPTTQVPRQSKLIIQMSLNPPPRAKPVSILNKAEFSFLSAEARCVRAIKACNRASDVQAVLDASSPTALTPNTAAAAMRTMLKFDKQSDTAFKALPLLLEVAGSGVLHYRQSKATSDMTLFALQDVLYSLSLLRKDAMAPLAIIICEILANEIPRVMDTLQPRRLVEILEAAHYLKLQRPQPLFRAIADRLCKSDALGKLQSPKLCEALVALAPYPVTAKGFLRRLRKQKVRRELNAQHIIMAIQAAGFLWTKSEDPVFAEEVEIMAYTFVNRELSRPILQNTTTMVTKLSTNQAASALSAISKFGWDNLMVVDDLCDQIDCQVATPVEIALILQSLYKLDIDRHDLISQLGSRLFQCIDNGYRITLQQLNIILLSVLRLSKRDSAVQVQSFVVSLKQILLSDDAYSAGLRNSMSESDIARYVWFLSQTCGQERDPEIGMILGNRLLSLASEESRPASIVMAVRYAVKMYAQRYPQVLHPYLEVVQRACQNTGAAFLSTISSQDLSFLIETLVIAKCTDEALFVALATTAVHTSIVDDCSPSSARRIMTSFTTVVPRISSFALEGYQHQLFDSLGANLLSTQLKPYEAAGAVFAYAKAGYLADMGVFDHVSEIVSQNLAELPVRSVAQCLWACGKMYAWEPTAEFSISERTMPPYMQSARKYAKHLSTRQNELSAKDLAQILWAIGRLGIDDRDIIHVFADRVEHVISDCYAIETSNIMWGLSKSGYNNQKRFVGISRRMLGSDVRIAPKEAACVLFALGNLGIREDEVFEHLSAVLMEQMENVSAQAMANTLWAHNIVGKLPPSGLMQSWAADKLGLVGVQPFDPEFEMQ